MSAAEWGFIFGLVIGMLGGRMYSLLKEWREEERRGGGHHHDPW